MRIITDAPPSREPASSVLARARLVSRREAEATTDTFDRAVSTGNVSGRLITPRPEPVVAGPIPEADRPQSSAARMACVAASVLGLAAVAGGAILASVALPLGILLAVLGLLALIISVLSQPRELPVAEPGGRNRAEFVSFSGEVAFTPAYYHRPSTEAEVVALVRTASATGSHIKVVGSAHSFVGNFATSDHLVSLERLNAMQVIDRTRGIVRVGAGAKISDVSEFLAAQGLAFSNLGGITAQSIVGALQTGTHGSGIGHGILSTQVERLRLLTADGEVRWISRATDPELFSAALVGLGGLGIITEVELRAVPAFNLEERVTRVSFEQAFDQSSIEAHLAENEYFQIVWVPHADAFLVERNRTALPVSPDWARPSDDVPLSQRISEHLGLAASAWRALRPAINRFSTATRPEEEAHVGRSDAILTRPVGPRQRETEYALPVARAAEAMHALRDAIEREGLLMNYPCCMRFVRGDDIMLSPANRGDSVYISVLLAGSEAEDDRIMHIVQRVLREHGGRPHWGKELELDAAGARHDYGDDYDRYRALRDALDPSGMFRNPYLDRLFPPRP